MNVMKYGRYLVLLVMLVNFMAVLGATNGGTQAESNITNAMCEIYYLVKNVMAAVMLVLIILAAIVYAAGQVLGAETRARANVWATSMFVGAVIGALIYIVVPLFLNVLLGDDVNIDQACGDAAGQ
ncbi:hypothetical protein JXB01_04435 [Candidatus Micrarchaeota archaeon]|nr:hypothetical protein [Candidatus Micrarchaeota archaeon]